MKAPAIPAAMKAIRLHPPGGVENLRFDELPTPTPGTGEVLVHVHAAGITRDELDWATDRLPAIPSYELSGVVVAVGEGTDGFERRWHRRQGAMPAYVGTELMDSRIVSRPGLYDRYEEIVTSPIPVQAISRVAVWRAGRPGPFA